MPDQMAGESGDIVRVMEELTDGIFEEEVKMEVVNSSLDGDPLGISSIKAEPGSDFPHGPQTNHNSGDAMDIKEEWTDDDVIEVIVGTGDDNASVMGIVGILQRPVEEDPKSSVSTQPGECNRKKEDHAEEKLVETSGDVQIAPIGRVWKLSGPYACHVCGSQFRKVSFLKRLTVELTTEAFVCGSCESKIRNAGNLKSSVPPPEYVDDDIITDLQIKPFRVRSYESKLSIVQSGRPCPTLKNLCTHVKERSRSYTRRFTISYYDYHDWLCGSEKSLKLYCWPCLLFSESRKDNWITGYTSLCNISKSAKCHGSYENHLQCVIDLYSFGKCTSDEGSSKTSEAGSTLHNQKVKKNREILKTLIDVTCFLAKQELPFRGHDESKASLNQGNYIETLNLLKTRDHALFDHLENPTEFAATSSDIQNDLIFAVGDVVNEAVLKEINDSEFVAVIMCETSDVRCRSQVSTVLRFFHEGKNCVEERFVGFLDIQDQTADALLVEVKKIVDKFQLKNKLIAHSYDGAVVMSDQLSYLHQKVGELFRTALFWHCSHHVVNLVLAQGMNEIPECNMFFSSLNGVATFGSQSAKETFAVEDHLKRSVPGFAPTTYCFTSRLVITVEHYRGKICSFFDSIHEDRSGQWNGLDKWAAHGYAEFLNNFETVFLLNVFSPLFSQSDVFFTMLQSDNIDMMACANHARDFHYLLKSERQGVRHCVDCKTKHFRSNFTESNKCANCKPGGFQLVWDKTVSSIGMPEPSKKKRSDDLSPEERYRKLYLSIIDHLITQFAGRFSSLENLPFFEILNARKFATFSLTNGFPDALLHTLGSLYPGILDLSGLQNELTVFYRNPLFHGKTPLQLTKFLKDGNLHLAFKQLFRLAKLISTIPATTASFERSSSALQRVQTYLKSAQCEEQFSLATLSIEKQLLMSLEETAEFHEMVIEKFCAKSKRDEFIFK